MTLGEKLRQAREERKITISEVSEQTRISPLYLEAIEADDYRALPGGIFNKGFIKSFAKYVGFDEQEALQDYARQFAEQNDGQNADELKTRRPEVLTDDRSSSIPTIIFAVIILGLMTWGILALVRYIQNQPDAPAPANANAANSANQNAPVSPTPTPLPATDEIKIEFKTTAAKVSVTAKVDGKTTNEVMTNDAPKIFTGKESVKLAYYKGFADKVQITLNGKQITPPAAATKGSIIEFEVNKNNIVQILQSGQITPAAPTPAR